MSKDRNCGCYVNFEEAPLFISQGEGRKAGKCKRWDIVTFQNWNSKQALWANRKGTIILIGMRETCYQHNPNPSSKKINLPGLL